MLQAKWNSEDGNATGDAGNRVCQCDPYSDQQQPDEIPNGAEHGSANVTFQRQFAELTLKRDIGTSVFGTIGNLVWLLLIGIWIALAHTIAGVACCITILGIPFGLQHFKLAGLAVAPIGK